MCGSPCLPSELATSTRCSFLPTNSLGICVKALHFAGVLTEEQRREILKELQR